MQGTRGGQGGGAEEEDEAGNIHERVKALRGKGKWENSGGKNRRKMTGEREGGWRVREQSERRSRMGVVASPLDCY